MGRTSAREVLTLLYLIRKIYSQTLTTVLHYRYTNTVSFPCTALAFCPFTKVNVLLICCRYCYKFHGRGCSSFRGSCRFVNTVLALALYFILGLFCLIIIENKTLIMLTVC